MESPIRVRAKIRIAIIIELFKGGKIPSQNNALQAGARLSFGL
jgi:hypothetical protein